METRAPHLRAVIMPIAFTLLCVLLTLAVLDRFGGTLPLQPKGYRIVVPLPDAANLATGSDVQIAGVDVGRVVTVDRAGNRADATVELRPEFAPLRSGARAIVRTKTLLGEAYLEVAPGPREAPRIPENGRLAADHVRPTVPLDEFLETFEPTTRDDLRGLFAGMATAFGDRGPQLNRSIGEFAPVVANFDAVLRDLDAQGSDLQTLFARSGDVLDALGRREGVLEAAVRAGDAVLDTTGDRSRELRATVRELGPFLRQLDATSTTLTAAAPDLEHAVGTLEPLAPSVRPALEGVTGAAPEFRGLFRELPGLIAAGNRGLPSLPPLARAARTGFRAFYPASRELIPLLQLLAVNRLSAVFFFANVAQVMNGVFVGPGGLLRNYGVGIITTWNETLAGWKKKLPTNRQNPYPKPPYGLLDTGRLGYLKAYDCRHVDNPPYLAPTGTGAPPCVEQGPWKFNGKSRYYPRLTLAPP